MTKTNTDSGAHDKCLATAKEVRQVLDRAGLTDWEEVAVLDTVKFAVQMTGWKKAEKMYRQEGA